MKKKRLLQIGVVCLMLLLIAGVWALKRNETETAVENALPGGTATATPAIETPAASAVPQSEGAAFQPTPSETASATPAVETPATSAAPHSEGAAFQPTPSVTPEASNPDFTLETAKIDLEQLLSYQLPVIIDFGSDSCIPCKAMAPVLRTMNAETQGKAIIKFVDVWKNPDGASGFPIQVIPTQLIYLADGSPYVPGDAVKQSGLTFTYYQRKSTGEHVLTVHQGGLTEAELRLILGDLGVE